MTAIAISNTVISQDADGRFSLNDLHRAAGGERRHGPTLWLGNQQTQELVAEVAQELGDTGNPVSVVRGGASQGTYVCKELVYAYATWISAAFHLKVIRAYDAAQTYLVAMPDFSNPVAAARAWADAREAEQEAVTALAKQQPAVEFAYAVRGTGDLASIRDVAKLLGTGQNRFFDRLRADGVLMADNRPYQSYIERGYFRVSESVWHDDKGQAHISFKTLVTGKGQIWLQHRYGKSTVSISRSALDSSTRAHS